MSFRKTLTLMFMICSLQFLSIEAMGNDKEAGETIDINNYRFRNFTVGVSSLTEIENIFGKGRWKMQDPSSASGSVKGCYKLDSRLSVEFESWSISSPYIINLMRVGHNQEDCVKSDAKLDSILPGSGIFIGMSIESFEKATSLVVVSETIDFTGGMLRDDGYYVNQGLSASFKSKYLIEFELQSEIEWHGK